MGRHARMLVQIFEPTRHGHETCALGFTQHGLRQALGPGLKGHGVGNLLPVWQVVDRQTQHPLYGSGFGETKTVVKHHRHHFRRQFHHLHQKGDFVAFFGQPLAQHILAFGIRQQIVEFGLISRAQVMKVGGNFH